MEITRKNFRSELPKLKEAINAANFISLDCEFTGLAMDAQISPYDTPSEAYEKLTEKTSEFIVVQLGLTTFQQDPIDAKTMKYRSFNFYLYPRLRSQTFVSQGESLSFLSSIGFDFNKLFSDGLSYCTVQEEIEMRKAFRIKQKQKAEETKDHTSHNIPVPEGEMSAIQMVKEIVEKFLKSQDTSKVIDGCTPFQRKLVYQMLQSEFDDTISVDTKIEQDGSRLIVIQRKRTPEQILAIELEKQKKDLEQMEDNIGVLMLMKILSESKKLIVGHNMLMDLVYILRQFFGEFSTDADEFKVFANRIFPYILDTKYLAGLENVKPLIKSTVLKQLFELVQKDPFAIPKIVPESAEHEYLLNADKNHEAGFDSFMTGVVLLGLTGFMKIQPSHVSNQSNVLKMHFNRVHMMRLVDVAHLNLAQKDPSTPRNYVFHLSFPEDWKLSDIQEKFNRFGNIHVFWVDPTSALVGLYRRDQWRKVMQFIKSTENFRILTFEDYKSGKNKPAIKKPLTKRQIKRLKMKESAELMNFGPRTTPSSASKTFETCDDYNNDEK